MLKKIFYALITAMVIWLVYTCLIPINKEENKPVETSNKLSEKKISTTSPSSTKISKKPKPKIDKAYAYIPDFKYRQGDVVPIKLKNFIEEDFDKYEIKSNLASQVAPLKVYKINKHPFALLALNSDTMPDIYKVEVYKDDKLLNTTIFEVYKRDFEIQHLAINKSFEAKKTPENLKSDKDILDNAKVKTSPTPYFSKRFIYPVKDYFVTTSFQAIRFVNNTNIVYRHSGIDMAVPMGTKIEVSNTGIVTFAGETISGGNTIIVDHGIGIFTQYMHLNKIYVKKGQEVKQGEIIGEVGTTGFSTGAHLHFDACIENTYIDPEQLIKYNILDKLKE